MNKTDEYNKIDEYIDSIYKNFDCGDRETKMLKEEMREHLYEEVEELKRQGMSEEQGIDKALDSFGQENNVVNEMNNVLKSRSIFTKMLIRAGSVIFAIACLFQIVSLFYKDGNTKYINNTSEYVINQLFYQIKNNDFIGETTKGEIDKILDEFNKKNSNGLYYVQIKKTNDIEYVYKKEVSRDQIQKENEGVMKVDSWSVDYKKTDVQQIQDQNTFNEIDGISQNLTKNRLKGISYLLFMISLAIWDIAFYYYFYTKNNILVWIAFMLCDCVVCLPFLIITSIFPQHVKETMAFVVGTTFVVTLILRIAFIKGKKVRL